MMNPRSPPNGQQKELSTFSVREFFHSRIGFDRLEGAEIAKAVLFVVATNGVYLIMTLIGERSPLAERIPAGGHGSANLAHIVDGGGPVLGGRS